MWAFDNVIIKSKKETSPIDLLGKVPSCPTVKVWIEGTLWRIGFSEEERDAGLLSKGEWIDDEGGMLPYITITSFSLFSDCGFLFSFAFSLLCFTFITGSSSTSTDIALAGDKPIGCVKITYYIH